MKSVLLATLLCAAVVAAPAFGIRVADPLKGGDTVYTHICTSADEATWVAAALAAVSNPTAANFPPAPPKFCIANTHQVNKSLAAVTYRQTLNQTGWNDLIVDSVIGGIPAGIHTPTATHTALQLSVLQSILLAQAAGYAEGYVSYEDFQSTLANAMFMQYHEELEEFRVANDAWMRAQMRQYALLASNTPTNVAGNSDYWRISLYNLMYFDGMWAATDYMNVNRAGGFPASYMPPVSKFFFWEQNAQGDVLDLMAAYNISSHGKSIVQLRRENPLRMGHCSALIKMTYNMSDIYVAHATWGTYNMMLRVFKTISVTRIIPGNAVSQKTFETRATKVSFSSYPSVQASIDDFYVSSKSLAITETSLSVFNQEVYNVGVNMGPNTMLYYMRVMAATEMADTGKQWVDLFGLYNSGTYNNQWMVVDKKAFTPYKPFEKDVLWVSEQFPGRYETFDASRILALGYFPSYNIPYLRSLFNYAGYNTQLNGTGWQSNSYEECSRAQIFRRQANSVKDIDDMKYIMQFNAFQTDPASYGNPTNSVASRGDLKGVGNEQPACWGAMDVKLVSMVDMDSPHSHIHAYNGPSPQQGAFSFSSMPPNTMMCFRNGMPDTYNFAWQKFAA